MNATGHEPLSVELNLLLQTDGEALTVGRLAERIGDRGFGMLLVVLSLPSALPVPAAGYSVPFGILLLALAGQMLTGCPRPVIPKRLARVSMAGPLAAKGLLAAAWGLRRIEILVRPRMRWITSRTGQVAMGMLVLLMSILMMVPIPLTNTFPAAVIFLIGVGLTEDDGLFALGACLVGVVAVLLYGGLVYALVVYGPQVVEPIKEALLSWIGG